MDEAWERAVETALEGRADASPSAPRSLTLDGVVKCLQGRMPSPIVLERFQTLEHLSLANIGLSSLEKFPCLRNLQRLILSDNRIAGGLEFLVEAGLDSLRDLDLSNNRIQYLEDLAPLAQLRLVSLDLYECPVTRISDYRSRVFGMIRSLKYLDKMDSEENERPESDDEDEEDDEEEDDEDPGNGEVDGEDRVVRAMNGVGSSSGVDGIVDLDEDEESDADEEETDVGEMEEANGSSRDSRHHLSNGFIVQPVGEDVVEDEDGEDEEYVEDEDDLGEEVDAEEGGEEDDMVEIHEVEDSDEEDGVEEDEEEEDEVDGQEDDEVDGQEDDEVDAEDRDEEGDPSSTSRVISTEGEIDGHDLGEEDENGEIGEENGQVSGEDNEYDIDDGEEEEDFESEYLVRPVRSRLVMEGAASDLEIGDEEEDDSEEEVDDEDPDSRPGSSLPSSSSQVNKRKRDNDGEDDEDDGLDDDSVEDSRSSKRR